jgi:hypothetical protein
MKSALEPLMAEAANCSASDSLMSFVDENLKCIKVMREKRQLGDSVLS